MKYQTGSHFFCYLGFVIVAVAAGPVEYSSAQNTGHLFATSEMIRLHKDFKAREAIYLDPRSNPLTLTFGGICDAVRYPNGRIIYLNGNYGPVVWDYGEKEVEYLSYVSDQGNGLHKRIFADPADDKNIYAIRTRGVRNRGHSIIRHSIFDKGGEIVAGFKERITRPEYVISDSSVAYIYGRNGLIYRWSLSDGMSRWQIDKPADIKETRRNMFAKLHALRMGEAVCFYSYVDPVYPKKALRDLLVFTGQRPKVISLQNKATGPAVALDKKTIRFCRNDGFMDVNIETGEIKETAIDRPVVEAQRLIVTHFFRLANGKQFSLWRKPYRSYRKNDLPGFQSGYFNQFAEMVDGSWKMLSQGRDRLIPNTDHSAYDDQGGIWMGTSHGALLSLSAAGEFREFAFGSSFGFGKTSLMKFESGLLLIVDKDNDSLAFEEPKKLLGDSADSPGQWRVYYSRIPLEWDKRNQMVLFSINPGEGLLEFRSDGVASIDLPPPDLLDLKQPLAVTRDSNHEFWIFSDGDTGSGKDRTFWRHEGKWQVFEPAKLNDGQFLPSKEVAFQARLEMGVSPGYVIGRRHNKYRVSFGPNRRIVYRNEGNRVSYFDGKQWAWSRDGSEIADTPLEQQPFFRDGVTTIYDSEKAWNLTDEQWIENRSTDEPRPWNVTEKVPYPFEGEQYFSLITNYPDGKFSEDEAQWGYRACNILYSIVRAHDKLGMHYPSGLWNIIPARGTPVETDNSWDELWIGTHNRWFLQYPETDGIRKYIVFEPGETKIETVDSNLGEFDSPFAKVLPKWKTEPPLKKVQIRYRTNENVPWSAWVKEDTEIQLPGYAKPGKYKLQVQLGSEPRPLWSHALEYELTIKYDLGTYVTPLVKQLQSDEYETRRQATEELLMLGEAGIPHLEPLLQHRDAETRMTAEMVIKLLKTAKASNNDENEESK